MKLGKLKKSIQHNAVWAAVSKALVDDIPHDDKVFLECCSEILHFPLGDLILMYAHTFVDDRPAIKLSLQQMLDDKEKGVLHQGKRDREYYRNVGLNIVAKRKVKEEIEELTQPVIITKTKDGIKA